MRALLLPLFALGCASNSPVSQGDASTARDATADRPRPFSKPGRLTVTIVAVVASARDPKMIYYRD